MATILRTFLNWAGRISGAASERGGQQYPQPAEAPVPDAMSLGVDGALQLSAVWSCIDRRASVISSLPLFAYTVAADGQKTLARTSRLYQLLHETPNPRMTPMEFWRAMIMWHDLRGAAYARIDRDPGTQEATALWPMPTDQVMPFVLPDGSMVYEYRIDGDVSVLAERNVLVIKGLGNGTTGLDKLSFMRPTLHEAATSQASASRMFGTGGKPTGVLMVDNVLRPDQRKAVHERFAEMATGSVSRLYVLEANMRYQQLSLSPEDQQLLETRQFTVEEICRWFDVPPVLVYHSNVTAWGSGIEQIVAGWLKLGIRPMLVSIEQALKKRVLTDRQRATMTAEFSFEGLLRADPAARAQFYATALQNGYMTRNEVRQLENLPRSGNGAADVLTAQTNLAPIEMLGALQPSGGASDVDAQAPIAQ